MTKVARFIDLEGRAYNANGIISIKKEEALNEAIMLQVDLERTKENGRYFDNISYYWSFEFDGKVYKITAIYDGVKGETYDRSFDMIHESIDDLRSHFVDAEVNNTRSFSQIMDIIFKDSGYTWRQVSGSFANLDFENWGMDQATNLIDNVQGRWGFEYEIDDIAREVVFRDKVGTNANYRLRYKLNLLSLDREIDAIDFKTHGIAYGNEGKPRVEYTSPLAEKYKLRTGGYRSMGFTDNRFRHADSLYNLLKKRVDSTLRLALTVKLINLQRAGYSKFVPRVGDYILLYDPRLNIDLDVRIVKITSEYNKNLEEINTDVQLSNFSTVDEVQKAQERALNDIQGVFEGAKSLPNTAMSRATQQAVRDVQNTQTEVKFGEGINGMQLIDKDNPNYVVQLTSKGILLSENALETAVTAITGRGIIAEAILAGTITQAGLRSITIGNGYITSYYDKRPTIGFGQWAIDFYNMDGSTSAQFYPNQMVGHDNTKGTSITVETDSFYSVNYNYFADSSSPFFPVYITSMQMGYTTVAGAPKSQAAETRLNLIANAGMIGDHKLYGSRDTDQAAISLVKSRTANYVDLYFGGYTNRDNSYLTFYHNASETTVSPVMRMYKDAVRSYVTHYFADLTGRIEPYGNGMSLLYGDGNQKLEIRMVGDRIQFFTRGQLKFTIPDDVDTIFDALNNR